MPANRRYDTYFHAASRSDNTNRLKYVSHRRAGDLRSLDTSIGVAAIGRSVSMSCRQERGESELTTNDTKLHAFVKEAIPNMASSR